MKRPTRVLIVDDKEAARESLRLLLFGFDCLFSEAGDGSTALKLIQANEFDVLFLDLKLPDSHGIDILREARNLCAAIGKVIIITGLPDSRTLAEASELGIFRYLRKPLDYREIREVFSQAISDPPPSSRV